MYCCRRAVNRIVNTTVTDSRNGAIYPPGTEEEVNDGDSEDNDIDDVAEEER